MAHDSFRAGLASSVKSQDQVKYTLARICVSATRMYNFSAGISTEEFLLHESYVLATNAIKILLPGRILAGIPEKSFFLAGSRRVQISRREFFPERIQPGKRATSAGYRWDPGERRESWRDPSTYFTRVILCLTTCNYE